VPDFIVKTLFTESYSTFIPKRCSALALSATPFGIALMPDKPLSFNAIAVDGKPKTSFFKVTLFEPALPFTVIVLVLSKNLKPCVA
jgi:hypothetical protein